MCCMWPESPHLQVCGGGCPPTHLHTCPHCCLTSPCGVSMSISYGIYFSPLPLCVMVPFTTSAPLLGPQSWGCCPFTCAIHVCLLNHALMAAMPRIALNTSLTDVNMLNMCQPNGLICTSSIISSWLLSHVCVFIHASLIHAYLTSVLLITYNSYWHSDPCLNHTLITYCMLLATTHFILAMQG